MGEMATPTSLMMLIVAVANFVGSATLVACTVSPACAGRNGGAVKTPLAEIVPTVLLPPGMPATLQLTAVLAVFDTIAVRVAVPPRSTGMVVGATLTETARGGGVGELGFDPAAPHPPVMADSAVKHAIKQVDRREGRA